MIDKNSREYISILLKNVYDGHPFSLKFALLGLRILGAEVMTIES
jgi:hypothetical protein